MTVAVRYLASHAYRLFPRHSFCLLSFVSMILVLLPALCVRRDIVDFAVAPRPWKDTKKTAYNQGLLLANGSDERA